MMASNLAKSQAHEIPSEVYHVADGSVALDYLYQRGSYADPEHSPRPHIMLLDLRLPRVNGFEVLQEVKSSKALRAIPVVVLTSSDRELDVARAYDAYANSYIIKPIGFIQFAALLNDLGDYWLGRNYYHRDE